jgi:small-conductance mechanosensitive channel
MINRKKLKIIGVDMRRLSTLKVVIVLITLLAYLPGHCLLPFTEADKAVALTFFSAIEQRKKRIDELEKQLTAFKKRAENENISLTKTITKVKLDINNVQLLLKKASDDKSGDVDYLNKKLMLLYDRKQNISRTQELWKNGIEFIEKNIKIDREIIEFLQGKKEDLKPVYSWKEFRDAQIRASEFSAKIDAARSRRDHLAKQRDAEREKVVTLLKHIEVKNRERDKVIAGAQSGATSTQKNEISHDADLLHEEINTLEEQAQFARLTIDALNLDAKLQDDEIDFFNYRLNDFKSVLGFIEKRLVLDYDDVELARSEWNHEAQKTLQIKEDIDFATESKKDEKVKIGIELDQVRTEVSNLKTAGKKNDASTKQLSSLLKKLETKFAVIEKELALFEAKKTLAEMSRSIKEQQFNMIDLQYRLRRPIEKTDLIQLLTNFKTQKEFAVSILKSLNNKRNESYSESTRSTESMQAREEKIKDQENTIFKDKALLFEETLKNIREAKKNLDQLIVLREQYLGVNSDLINTQEKIINQYDLILNDLEHRVKTMSIWKRSSKAITFNEFTSAINEADMLFRRMFWETPRYFSPITIAHLLKDWVVYDTSLVLLFIIFFLVAFVGSRFFLKKSGQRTLNQLTRTHPSQRAFFYNNIILACINFALEHFILLFTWFFLYLHILFKFSYIFAGLKRFATPFYLSAFFIFSIPILVYLSHQLLSALKDLNKKLSYLFFAEKLQDRLISLLTMFFYSTAILIPLRLALISYAQAPSQFAVVILAAYSLILIIILALFVSKEYALTLIPVKHPILMWLKRSIDRHYYPVFFFVIALLILSNPYIGYSNLAWYLSFVVPSSVLLVLAIFSLHHYIRKYSVFLFMKEEDDEISDKFEYAKTYYGFFVIFTFIVLLFVAFLLVSRLWGYNYGPADIWKLLAEEWVIRIDSSTSLGFVQFIVLTSFIAGGFLISSLTHKFVFNKLFDILRTEPGTQNTFSRIFHYTTIGMAIMLGFTAIKLGQFIGWVGGFLIIGIGLALKDLVIDFVAGFFVLIERPIEIGNYISVDDVEGTVRKIAARSTIITTGRNQSVIIPNKDLVNKQIINWGHGRFAIGVELYIRVEHDADPEVVRKIITSVLQSNPLILRVPNIVVRLEGLEENALYFLARGFISARRVKDQFEIASSLRIEVVKAFREHGIALAQPQRVIHMAADRENEQKPVSPLEIKFDRP